MPIMHDSRGFFSIAQTQFSDFARDNATTSTDRITGTNRCHPQVCLALRGSDKTPEYKITAFQSDRLATCHVKLLKFMRKSKKESRFSEYNKT